LRTAGYALHVALSADGHRVAAAPNDRVTQVWDPRTGTPASSRLAHPARVAAISLSRDGNLLLTASETEAFIWAVESDELLARYSHGDDIVAVQFSSDDSHAVIVSADSVAIVPVSSSQTQQQLTTYSKLHAGRYLSPSGKLVSLKPNELRELWLLLVLQRDPDRPQFTFTTLDSKDTNALFHCLSTLLPIRLADHVAVSNRSRFTAFRRYEID